MNESLKNKILDIIKDHDKEFKKDPEFIPGQTYLPASSKYIDENEKLLIIESALDGWLTTGKFNDAFEKKLANFLGIKYLLTTNSGSSANLLAFSALTSESLGDKRIVPGDEVITVAAGFPTTINPIIIHKAVPVFIDIDLKTHNIDTKILESAITKKTKAVMLAHSLGNPFNLEIVLEICKKYNLWLIEDNCDALGSKFNGQLTGTFGDIGTLSFYPAHHITMGEGGAVFTNDFKLKKIIESFRDWGRDCFCKTGADNTCGKRFDWQLGELPYGYDHKYTYSHMGFNLKITDMQAACGLAQIDKLENFIKKRKRNYQMLFDKLQKCVDFLDLPVATENSEPSWFGFLITIKPKSNFNRLELTQYLEQNKIGTRLLFAGNIVKQPYFKNVDYRIHQGLQNTDYVMNNSFWIGLHPNINEEKINYMVNRIETFLGLNF
jgi:CDP-6-deoxy-D-xylo-4-hexulose-3-dehydrase